jgi:hypothetical protein
MSNNIVSSDEIFEEIERLLKFPAPQICKHHICCNLLSLLERCGYPLSDKLVRAVVNADDETALTIINNGKKKRKAE